MNSLCVLLSLSLVIVTTNALKSHVFGGQDLLPYNHKYLVKLEISIINNTADAIQCSGSIISSNWILSAAHCFEKNTSIIKVLHSNPEDGSMEVIAMVKPSGITRNPSYVFGDYSPKNYEVDLALLKTSRSIKYNEYVQPIKMAKRAPCYKQSAVIAGYGTRELNLPAPREGMVSVLFSADCPDIRGTKLLCSIGYVRSGPGDSGGPLVSKNRLIGVITGGCIYPEVDNNCLTVYVNVAQHFDWIVKSKK